MEIKTLMEEVEKDITVLDTIDNQQLVWSLQSNLNQIIEENSNLAQRLELEQIIPLIYQIQQASHIFVTAVGRSGFAMRSAAMRLMHLGFSVYFVGDTTTPAIKKGDLLIAASGSGTTETIIRAADQSINAGAKLVGITTNATSKLAQLSTHTIIIPAAEKQDHSKKISNQYAGSLFEQFLLLPP